MVLRCSTEHLRGRNGGLGTTVHPCQVYPGPPISYTFGDALRRVQCIRTSRFAENTQYEIGSTDLLGVDTYGYGLADDSACHPSISVSTWGVHNRSHCQNAGILCVHLSGRRHRWRPRQSASTASVSPVMLNCLTNMQLFHNLAQFTIGAVQRKILWLCRPADTGASDGGVRESGSHCIELHRH